MEYGLQFVIPANRTREGVKLEPIVWSRLTDPVSWYFNNLQSPDWAALASSGWHMRLWAHGRDGLMYLVAQTC